MIMMMMKSTAALLLFSLIVGATTSTASSSSSSSSSSSPPAAATPATPGYVFSTAFEEAHASFHAGNSTYAKLVRLATTDTRPRRAVKLAELSGERVVVGDREAKYRLGAMLARGRVMKTNMKESEKWFRLAAEQGHPKAQFALAQLYHVNQGQGTRNARRADEEAAHFMRMAARNGHAKAQYHYALMRQHGKGTDVDDKEAAQWYRKSAEQGFVPSMYNLSVMYRRGEGGLRRSGDDADKWFTRAIKAGKTTYAQLRSYSAHKALNYGSKRPHLHRR
jgi:TPR repeat protein